MHNGSENGWLSNGMVRLGANINSFFYFALAGLYNIIVEISSAEILSPSIVRQFFERVQLIIGVVMIFRLSITILQGIVDPDKATDSKAGMGNIIVRIITGLVLLSTLIPLKNLPNSKDSYQTNLKNHGILFGTMYEVQSRILNQNVIGKIVLKQEKSYEQENLKSMGEVMASSVLKSFFTPNLNADTDTTTTVDKDTGRFLDEDLFCTSKGEDYDDYDKYYDTNKTTGEILDMADEECGDYYAYNFNWFSSLLMVIIFDIIFILLCIETGKRAIKLAILRLIAPIPVISYMGSNSDMQSSRLGTWGQVLISTYVDLFVLLAMIFFAMSIISKIAADGLTIGTGNQAHEISIWAKLFIYVALLLFVKEGPKFIKQALGMKEEGSSFGSSLAAIAGAGALGAKKLAGGAYSKARGGSFRDGAGQFQSDNKFLAAKRSLDQNNENLQARKQGKQEIKQMDRDWNKGQKWYNKENPYRSQEFTNSVEARDQAKEEFETAKRDYYSMAESGMIKDAQTGRYRKATRDEMAAAYKKMDDKEGAYKGAQEYHDAMRKKHSKDAKREDQISFYKHNEGGTPASRAKAGNSSSNSYTATGSMPSNYESETLPRYEGSGSYSSIETPETNSTPVPSMENSRYTSEGNDSGTDFKVVSNTEYFDRNKQEQRGKNKS
ncbi:MAG: hypothetical protein IJF92_04030 [Bacilli bacterium]|nr:hypothetical protein [Bacilli bacterium]